MPLLSRKPVMTDAEKIHKLIQEKHELMRLLNSAGAEVQALQALLDGKVPQAAAWLMSKVARQRVILNARHRKATARHLALRAHALAGHVLTPDMWAAAKAEFSAAHSGDTPLPKEPPTGADGE